ncbi:FecR domain-containing protein [Pseudomonas sp. H9]|uniref:FecR domain-containing protein n=1 Tax=Pseudomonas sp. H9 TaxID=483968 RepID=UPI001057AF70|nr:FecR domain-containing protein [Pseudomonas sp. H9]TDF84739.1 iron dicitrate transport regulator FecR [Pseudomonas sp. H9]
MISAEQRQALSEAADWYARQPSHSAQLQQQWQHWKQRSEVNAWAWQRVELLQAQLAGVDGAMAGKVLARATRMPLDRRTLLRCLLLGLGVSALGLSGYRQAPVWLADVRTERGQRRTLNLADGSQLTLNTSSAVDVQFDAQARRVVLLLGEVLIETAKDARPFYVVSAQGQMQALGTRFIVRQYEGSTDLAVLEHAVAVSIHNAHPAQRIEAGQGVRFDSAGIVARRALQSGEGEWVKGHLLIDGWRLDRLLAELGRYRPGYLGCAEEVAHLQLSGSFPLDNTDQALAAIARAVPVDIRQHTRFWTRVMPRA